MLTVAPFNGVRYDTRVTGSLRHLVTPPYDIISAQEQAQFYRSHPKNFIRVNYNKQYPSDNRRNNRYQRAQSTLDRWLHSGVLKPDAELSVYPYQQTYSLDGKSYDRWGVLALVRLDSDQIYRHEHTRAVPQQDRLDLLESVEACLSPIFGIIPDTPGSYRRFVEQACLKKQALARLQMGGAQHRFWKVSDPQWIAKLQKMLAKKSLMIADGHHRFEAAVTYRKQQMAQSRKPALTAPFQYTLFYLASMGEAEPGLMPTHRILSGLQPADVKRFLGSLNRYNGAAGEVESPEALQRRLKQLQEKKQIAVGIYTQEKGRLLQAQSKTDFVMDVEWLHHKLLPDWLLKKGQMSYTQDLALGLRRLKRGQSQLVFALAPPSLKEVLSRAQSLQRMPGKTTYFYPKLLDGFVEYLFHVTLR